jgi:hypothetical protein
MLKSTTYKAYEKFKYSLIGDEMIDNHFAQNKEYRRRND